MGSVKAGIDSAETSEIWEPTVQLRLQLQEGVLGTKGVIQQLWVWRRPDNSFGGSEWRGLPVVMEK